MRAFWMAKHGRGPFGGGPFGGGPFGGPFGDDPFGGEGGPRRRHRRGDIKFALLELLAEQPRHGYDLIKELESRYAGFYRPSPGTVYPTLQLLEDEGHLTSEQVEGKRIYTITESGRQLLAERQAGEGEGHPGFRHGAGGEGLDALRRNSMALVEVVMQAARHGTPDQVRAVTQVLDGARREVYRILAGGQE
jgi:DNA-binding PadR family transcriptional regulator